MTSADFETDAADPSADPADPADSAADNGRVRGAETARRALRLIETLIAEQPVRLDTLVERTGLTKSTAYRLMRVLQEEGYAEKFGHDGYRAGPRCAVFAEVGALNVHTYAPVRAILQQLSRATGETVTLHQRAGDLAILVAGAEDETHALRMVSTLGESNLLVRGASGLAVLAHLDPAEAERIVARYIEGRTDRAELLDRLRTIAGRGFAVSSGVNHPGVRGIAAPVLRDGAPTTMSVAVVGPAERFTEQRALAVSSQLTACCVRLAAYFTAAGQGSMR
ncbi:IclR family transcriptional regulator [Streptacidiphilus sp. N1-12]|uniref:IclR family transcriptional regulator n=2 Tax=Streptacidiphilus alkalitolerans TaxID=3342712 RepID=A0ABV6V1S8_9ACTN